MHVTNNQMTKCDYVTEKLKEMIITGVYKPGDQLPPESALCEMLEVSRITVREALKKLSMMGMIEIKQGKGTFVKAVDLGLFMKPIYQLIDFEEIDVEAIYSAREYIESGTAFFAAQRRTDRELAVLQGILQNLRAAILAEEVAKVSSFDKAFHLEVAKAAHNPILYACIETIEEINRACVTRLRKYYDMLANCYAEHFAIYRAIEQQDPEAAKAAIVAHTISSKELLR